MALEDATLKLANSVLNDNILGIKIVVGKIQESAKNASYIDPLCYWIIGNDILMKYVNDDCHAEILKYMPVILKFLYDCGQISKEWIDQLI